MVSTRHSISADEILVSLDTAAPSPSVEQRSTPLKRSREFPEETPETQSFVDARATPFEQRKTDRSEMSKQLQRKRSRRDISSPVEFMSPDSEVEENTDILGGDNGETSIVKDSVTCQPGAEEMSSVDSDDEAPEALSNVAGAEFAKSADQSRKVLLSRQAEEAAQKRRRHQERLLQQKEQNRNLVSTEVANTSEIGIPNKDIQKQRLPRFLPDDILMAPIEATASRLDADASGMRNIMHRRFEQPKETKSLQKGLHTIQLAERVRRDMAPKSKHQTLSTKNSWLFQRGQKGRRPLRKTLT